MRPEFPPYKGYKITYNESSNTWDGEAAGTAESLLALKVKIDNIEKAGRKIGIKALQLHSPGWRDDRSEVREVTITSIAEGRDYGAGEAWITYADGKNKERSKVSISQLYPVEMRSKLEEFLSLKKAAADAEKQADRFIKALDGFTKDSLKKAVEPKGGG